MSSVDEQVAAAQKASRIRLKEKLAAYENLRAAVAQFVEGWEPQHYPQLREPLAVLDRLDQDKDAS